MRSFTDLVKRAYARVRENATVIAGSIVALVGSVWSLVSAFDTFALIIKMLGGAGAGTTSPMGWIWLISEPTMATYLFLIVWGAIDLALGAFLAYALYGLIRGTFEISLARS